MSDTNEAIFVPLGGQVPTAPSIPLEDQRTRDASERAAVISALGEVKASIDAALAQLPTTEFVVVKQVRGFLQFTSHAVDHQIYQAS